jgi:hypothetical protein
MLIVKDGNARSTLVDPSAKLLVPLFDFKNGGCGTGNRRNDKRARPLCG